MSLGDKLYLINLWGLNYPNSRNLNSIGQSKLKEKIENIILNNYLIKFSKFCPMLYISTLLPLDSAICDKCSIWLLSSYKRSSWVAAF